LPDDSPAPIWLTDAQQRNKDLWHAQKHVEGMTLGSVQLLTAGMITSDVATVAGMVTLFFKLTVLYRTHACHLLNCEQNAMCMQTPIA